MYDFMPNISIENYKNVFNYSAYHGTKNILTNNFECTVRCQNSLDNNRNYCNVTKHQSGCTYNESRFYQREHTNC